MALIFILSLSASMMAWGKVVSLDALEKKTQGELLTAEPALKGGDFTRMDLENAIKWLVTFGNYDSASYVSSDEEHFLIKVGKTKRVRAIVVEGNKSIGDPEIRIAFGIAEQAVFDTDALLEAGKKIQALYKDQGLNKF